VNIQRFTNRAMHDIVQFTYINQVLQ